MAMCDVYNRREQEVYYKVKTWTRGGLCRVEQGKCWTVLCETGTRGGMCCKIYKSSCEKQQHEVSL